MGGAASHFADTNWETADGGVTDTFDGAKPTSDHSIFQVTKQNLVSQRECELKDEDGALLYATKPVQGTTKDFDVLGSDSTKLFHVHTGESKSHWEIFSYKPNYDGQAPVPVEKAEGDLYRKAKVTVAWDKYHGVINLYEQSPDDPQGVLSKSHILKIEEIKSITPQFQSFVPRVLSPKMGLAHPQLSGYWVREHTAKTDLMKIHLAKNTDIVLHCIMVVITNIVHVERNSEQS
jgi:hypothetical protein